MRYGELVGCDKLAGAVFINLNKIRYLGVSDCF